MIDQTLACARGGDEEAFRKLTDPHLRELPLHIYRIVGSVQDADDLLQESLLGAWRGLEQFEVRASVQAPRLEAGESRTLAPRAVIRASVATPAMARPMNLALVHGLIMCGQRPHHGYRLGRTQIAPR